MNLELIMGTIGLLATASFLCFCARLVFSHKLAETPKPRGTDSKPSITEI